MAVGAYQTISFFIYSRLDVFLFWRNFPQLLTPVTCSCHSSFRCPDFVTDLAVSGAFVLSLWGWAIVVTYNCLYQLYADVCRPNLCFQRSFITL